MVKEKFILFQDRRFILFTKLYWILFIISAIFFSCQPNKGVEQIVKEWQGKEILIPDGNLTYCVLGHDTCCTDLWDKPYKILTYIDSIGCSACQLGLHQWMVLIDSCKQLQLDVTFVFVIHSDDFMQLTRDVQFFGFDYPLIYDYQNSFDKINHFPLSYRTFLLDKANKVKILGSPINNPRIWELYKKVILQQL